MKVIYNRQFPFRGYKCINLFGVLFVRNGCTMSDTDFNHEAIHTAQMREMLYVPFYVLYLLEWLVLLVKCRNAHTAYRNTSYEREAYSNQCDLDYLETRPMFNEFRNK